eukprot:m.309552 g.309552  ORF g.309552 m.309552 type:complete len:287 (+) comp46916_c0_seq1:46-906(+)
MASSAESVMSNSRGMKLFLKRWTPQETPKALLCIIHGIGEHVDRFSILADAFVPHSFLVFGQDLVGHGRSEGTRVDIEDFHHYIQDVLEHINQVKAEYPDIPLFLFGQSMGGAIALLTGLHSPQLFQGIILIAPAILLDPKEATRCRLFMARMVAAIMPQFSVGVIPPEKLSRNEKEVKAYADDPLVWHGGLKARQAVASLNAFKEIESRLAEIEFPFIVLHGENDQLALKAGSQLLLEKAQSEDKTLKMYPEMGHTLLHELEEDSRKVLQDIVDWVLSRLSSSQT